MTTMAQAEQASEALRRAEDGGFLKGSLMPGMFGCPDCGTAWVVASARPLDRCGDCGAQMTVLDARQIERAVRRVAG